MTLQANHYEIADGGIDGVVDTAGFTGQPVASVSFDGPALDGPTVQRGREGWEVAALVQVVHDGWTTSLRLVVPDVNLDDDGTPVEVEGYAVVLTERDSIGGPGLVDGAIQSYDLRRFTATASIVES